MRQPAGDSVFCEQPDETVVVIHRQLAEVLLVNQPQDGGEGIVRIDSDHFTPERRNRAFWPREIGGNSLDVLHNLRVYDQVLARTRGAV